MFELTADTARDYLVRQGRLAEADSVTVETLSGGVSNVVLKVVPAGGEPFVLKQSRQQLRTKADWFSRLERIYREAEAQRALSTLLPEGIVPAVLFEDRENYCYVMSAVRNDHAVWKRELLAGRVESDLFRRAGNLLGRIHAGTIHRPDFLSDPDDTTVFFELRVDPFYRRVALVHPTIRPAIDEVVAQMRDHRLCLVHADFSPKNILIHADGITLVDFETVHYGDPAFDLGFFFSHLWLKAVAVEAVRAAIVSGIAATWRAYQEEFVPAAAKSGASIASLSARAVPHLAGCLLARVDGKSPVDYLHQESQRALVRQMSLEMFTSRPADLDAAFAMLAESLGE